MEFAKAAEQTWQVTSEAEMTVQKLWPESVTAQYPVNQQIVAGELV